jgi:transcriptional regulator with XRE-family HTH domain
MSTNGRHALAQARASKKMTLERLAQRSGLSVGAVSRIETGVIRNPRFLTKKALAEALGFRVVDLWPPEGKKVHPDLRPPQRSAKRNGGKARSRRRAGA